jgi:hypothetical protein
MALSVVCLFGCIFTPFHEVTLYMSSCMYRLPKRHVMCTHFTVLTGSLWIMGIQSHLLPSTAFCVFFCNWIKKASSPFFIYLKKHTCVGGIKSFHRPSSSVFHTTVFCTPRSCIDVVRELLARVNRTSTEHDAPIPTNAQILGILTLREKKRKNVKKSNLKCGDAGLYNKQY